MLFFVIAAILCQKAFLTLRRPRKADLPAKCNDLYIVQDPVIPGQYSHQIIFDLFRIILLGKTKLPGYPFYVSVHHNTRLMVNVAAYDIGGLSASLITC